MPGRRAKTLAPSALNRVLRYVKHHADPTRSRVIVLLSVKAGLRAAEIAKLEWPMVLDAKGRIAEVIEIRDCIAKKGAGRIVPVHPDLRSALVRLLARDGSDGPVVRSELRWQLGLDRSKQISRTRGLPSGTITCSRRHSACSRREHFCLVRARSVGEK